MENISECIRLVHDTEVPSVPSISLWPDFDFRSLPLCMLHGNSWPGFMST